MTYVFPFQDVPPAQPTPTTEANDSPTVNVENAVDGTNNGNSPGIFWNYKMSKLIVSFSFHFQYI